MVAPLRGIALEVATALLLTAPGTFAEGTTEVEHIRGLSAEAKEVIAAAIVRSPTVAHLVAQIRETDVIVAVEVSRFGAVDTGDMHLLAATPASRYVLVRIARYRMSIEQTIGWLGHELQHVLELARSPDVRGEADLKHLYERIGDEWKQGYFETKAACDVQAGVLKELARPHPGS